MSIIDPRLKILWFFLYSILIFVSDNLPSQIMLMAFTFLGILITRIKFVDIFKKVKYLLLFLPLTFGIHLLFTTDFVSQIINNGLIGIRMNTFTIPFFYTLRIADFIIFMSWIMIWIDAEGVLDSVYLILKPLEKLKIPIDEFFQVIFIAIRFFPILQDEYKKMDANWKIYTSQDNQENQFVKIMNILVTLMIFTFRKADKLAISMHVRGYGQGPRTYYSNLKFRLVDLFFFIFSAIFFVIIKKTGGYFGSI